MPTSTSLRTSRKKIYGGKWSLKYKRSINCKRPKGFSQRQYCKYKNKNKNKNKNKTTRRTRTRKGGKIPDHTYLYFDKDNAPISLSHLNTLIRISSSAKFSPENIFTKLKEELGKTRNSSAIYLVDRAIAAMFGYIIGYVTYDDDDDSKTGIISFVELTPSVRGLGLCLPMLDAYIKNVMRSNPDIQKFQLYNIGGEASCRCYKRAFEMNGFTLKNDINCSEIFEEGRLMVFYKNE
jgi:hypothetical protein